MLRKILIGLVVLSVTTHASGEEKAAPGEKSLAGMSILGNDDAPKALVIVPWKSSVIGITPSLPRALDEALTPVDRDVFARELAYYRIRAGAADEGSSAAK
jgi:hypothetical protein